MEGPPLFVRTGLAAFMELEAGYSHEDDSLGGGRDGRHGMEGKGGRALLRSVNLSQLWTSRDGVDDSSS